MSYTMMRMYVPPFSLEPELAPKWSGYRNSYLSEWGEYEPTNSWSFTRKLSLSRGVRERVYSYYRRAPINEIFFHLGVSGKYARSRCRPTSWTLSWSISGRRGPHWDTVLARGRCQSLASARRQAQEFIDGFDYRTALDLLYARSGAKLIFVWDGPELSISERLEHGRRDTPIWLDPQYDQCWKPFCTEYPLFDSSALPPGRYLSGSYLVEREGSSTVTRGGASEVYRRLVGYDDT